MPVKYRVLPAANLVHTVWSGVVTLEDAVRHNDGLRSDPDFSPSMRQLSDARGVESRVSGEGVRGLARHSAFGAESRRAIVVSDDTIFGVSRMYEAQAASAGEVQIFRDIDEALAWLGVDPSDLETD
jgi:hypothetical protein